MLADEGKKKVGILGTDGTIRTGVYQKECDARNIEAVSPPEDIQKLVMSIIYDEIKRGETGSRRNSPSSTAGSGRQAATAPSWAAPS